MGTHTRARTTSLFIFAASLPAVNSMPLMGCSTCLDRLVLVALEPACQNRTMRSEPCTNEHGCRGTKMARTVVIEPVFVVIPFSGFSSVGLACEIA